MDAEAEVTVAEAKAKAKAKAKAFGALLAGALVASTPACGGLEPWGEVVLVVDTDLPVPKVAGRLRVDLYSADGAWYESRDVALAHPTDWPASFSVFSDDESRAKDVLVRLRVYPEGKVRDYLGERFRERPVFVPPAAPRSIEEACAAPPELVLGQTLTVRRADAPFLGPVLVGSCEPYNTTVGSAAAFIDIPEPGSYWLGVLYVTPHTNDNLAENLQHVSLSLRRQCTDQASTLLCESGISPSLTYTLPSTYVDLDAGRYFVVTGGAGELDGAADVTLAAARADAVGQSPCPHRPRRRSCRGSRSCAAKPGRRRPPSLRRASPSTGWCACAWSPGSAAASGSRCAACASGRWRGSAARRRSSARTSTAPRRAWTSRACAPP